MASETSTAASAIAPKSVPTHFRISIWTAAVVLALAAGSIYWYHRRQLPLPRVVKRTQITSGNLPKANVLSDGSYLYLSETLQGRHVISKLPIEGHSPTSVQLPLVEGIGDAIAPDRSSILLSRRNNSQETIWTYPLGQGTSQHLQAVGRAATVSPDGQTFAFVRGAALWISTSNGGNARQLTTVEGTVFYPRFSPDGTRIRFSVGNTLQNTSTSSLWEIRSDATGLHPLFEGWHDPPEECCGSWTPDGHYFIFQVSQSRPANVTNLWAIAEPARTQSGLPISPIQITNGPMSFGMAAPDPLRNDKLWALGVQPAGEFVKYDLASQQFISILPGISGTDLDFSRDGKWIAYVAIPEGTLRRCRTDGSDCQELSDASHQVALPRWSPNGKHLVFMSAEGGKSWKTFIVPASGGRARQLIERDYGEVDANWSPDGTKIVFGDEWSAKNPNIRILDLKTGKISLIPGSQDLFSPRWSPNGRYIVALSTDFTKLMLFDFQTAIWSSWLVERAGAVSYPSWSADSQYLYFEDLVTGTDSIHRIKVGRHKPESILVLQGLERYPGPLGLWSGLAPDGSQVFVRDRSTQEVYGLDLDLP